MQDLQQVTHETHYENYRSERLQSEDFDAYQTKLLKEKNDEVS